jgi:hypothetical protein
MTPDERLALCRREITHIIENQKKAATLGEQLDAIKAEIDWRKAEALVLREIENNRHKRKSLT